VEGGPVHTAAEEQGGCGWVSGASAMAHLFQIK
jgi:hypothetical protein